MGPEPITVTATVGTRIVNAFGVVTQQDPPIQPSGQVTFKDRGQVLGTVGLNNTRSASFPLPRLAIGDHPITAEYSGDASFNGSFSTGVIAIVQQAGTTIEPGVSTSA